MIVSNDIIIAMESDVTPFRTTPAIVSAVAAIAQRLGRLEGVNLARPSPRLRRKNRIQTIHASLNIEGNSLTREQITALMDDKPVIGPRKDVQEVLNAIRVYDRLESFQPFSLPSLLVAHGMMMEGLAPDAGALRRGPIGVIRRNDIFHQAPAWENVASMMQALYRYLTESDDILLLRSCRFHFQLEHIHPFSDGNGRMGRLWQTCILMRYHPIFAYVPVEHLIRKHQSQYYEALAKGDDSGDCTEFVAFVLLQMENALHQLTGDTRSVTFTSESRLETVRSAFGGKDFSRKDYQTLLKTISTATASRDLSRGVEMGILTRSGDKRTTLYRFPE